MCGLRNALNKLQQAKQRMELETKNKTAPHLRKGAKMKQKDATLSFEQQLAKECASGSASGTLVGHPDIANLLIALAQSTWRPDRLLLVESDEVKSFLDVFAHHHVSFYIDRGLKVDPDSADRRCFFLIASFKVRRPARERLGDAYNVQSHEFAQTSKRSR